MPHIIIGNLQDKLNNTLWKFVGYCILKYQYYKKPVVFLYFVQFGLVVVEVTSISTIVNNKFCMYKDVATSKKKSGTPYDRHLLAIRSNKRAK